MSASLREGNIVPGYMLCTAILIAILASSGYAKIRDPKSVEEGILNLGLLPIAPIKFTTYTLPAVELLLALGLLIAPAYLAEGTPEFLRLGTFGASAMLTWLLMAFYVFVIARALKTGRTEGCNCFGRDSVPVTRYTLYRNIALLAAATGTLYASYTHGTSLIPELLRAQPSDYAWIFGALVLTALLWSMGEAKLQGKSSIEEEAPLAAQFTINANGEEEYVRMPIPHASLYPATNQKTFTTLRDMARTQARVLLFLSPTCSGCTRVAADIPAWQQQLPMLGIHPVYGSEEKLKQAVTLGRLPEDVSPESVLLDPHHATQHNFGTGVPMALILGSDGLLAGGPVTGPDEVRDLMSELVETFAPQAEEMAAAAASVEEEPVDPMNP